MRQRRNSDNDVYLLDEEADDSSGASSELGNCNWKVFTGIFIIQLVVNGVLASYGVFLLKLVEENVMSPEDALWTPVIYVGSCCFSDAVYKRISDRRGAQTSRFIACIGILMLTAGVITTGLLQRSRLQFIGYGLLGGVGASLVLTQTEMAAYGRHHQYNRNVGISHFVLCLGSSVAQFSMPLLLLGLLSLYGIHETPLLQAGLVLQGLVGVVILHPPTKRPSAISSNHSRPRSFTFFKDDSLYTSRSNGYYADSCTGRNSFVSSSYGHNWKNPNSCDSHPELNNCSGEHPVAFEIRRMCNKNGVEILPEIPEESEESSISYSSDIHRDMHTESEEWKFTDKVHHHEARSMDDCLGNDEDNLNLTDSYSVNKRWTIGMVDDMMPICTENGLIDYKSALDSSSSDVEDENEPYENTFQNSEHDNEDTTGRYNLLPVNGEIWKVGPRSDRTDLSDSDSLLSNSNEIRNFPGVRNVDFLKRKVKSWNNLSPELYKMKLENQRSPVNIYFSDEINIKRKNFPTHVNNIKQSHDIKHNSKRWSTGTLEHKLSVNSTLTSLDGHRGQTFDSHQKWHSDELRVSDQSNDYTGSFCKVKSSVSSTTQVPEDPVRTNADFTETDEKCHEVREVTVTLSGSREPEHPVWAAELMSAETLDFDSTSDNHEQSKLCTQWSRCPSSLCQLIQRLVFSCSCHFQHGRVFQRQYSQNCCNSIFWHVSEYMKIPYIFPSLLLRLTMRLCPMGFAVLTPLLVKRLIVGCTNEEAVFSVPISGFVWLCFVVVTPWYSTMPPNKRKYLFAAGNVVAAYGLYLLSNAESRDKMTLSCGIFGLGLGATMVTGNMTMYAALGTWNLAKVDVILDLCSGVLVLVAGSVMNIFIKDQEGHSNCFILLAVMYLVTGISWLFQPLLNRLHCQHHRKIVLVQ